MIYNIYFFIIFSTLFQDFFMLNIIGEFGRSLTAVVTIPIFIIYCFISKKKIQINKTIKLLGMIGIYLVIVNILNLIIYLFIKSGSINILDENIIVQSIKGVLYFINIIVFVVLIYNLQLNLSKEQIFKPFVFSYIFLFVILIIELISMPNALPFLHNIDTYYRVRLTTSESSWSSSLIVVFFSVSYYYYKYIKKNNNIKIFTILLFLTFIITSTSKGMIFNILISTFMIAIIEGKDKINIRDIIKSKFMLSIIGILTIALILITKELSVLIWNDLQNYTSIVTRVYTVVIGILLMFINPFGLGNALYLKKLPEALDRYIYVFENFDFNFNLSEIYSFIDATTSQNLAVKSGIIQYGLYWGIIGTVMIFIFFIKIYKDLFRKNKPEFIILKFGYINIILLLITVIHFDIKYEIWAFISLMICMGDNHYKTKWMRG